ncbi:MAG: hypothetical protein IT371_09600 [Deltaproteobacteria bacterium]|nr:hypothetical protein [Deltaproteobacteria bacterium]
MPSREREEGFEPARRRAAAWLGLLVCAVAVGVSGACKSPSESPPPSGSAPEPRAGLSAVQRRVLDEVLGWKTLDHDVIVYALPQVAAAGARLGVDGRRDSLTLGEASFLFVIDDAPHRLLEHPLRHVLVSESSGAVSVRHASNWPLLDGRAAFPTRLGELASEALTVYSTYRGRVVPPPTVEPPKDVLLRTSQRHVTCASGRAPRRYGVIGTGNGTGEDLLLATGHAMWVTLSALGFDVLLGAWGAKDPGAGDTFLQALAGLASQVECCDEVVVFVNAHGARRVTRKNAAGVDDFLFYGEDGQVYDNGQLVAAARPGEALSWDVRLGKRFISEAELADALKQLKACHITVVLEACFSGGFQIALAAVPGVERVFTSASSDEASEASLALPACPATHYLLKNFSVTGAKPDLGAALAAAWAAGTKESPFVERDGTSAAAADLTFGRRVSDRPTQSQRPGECVCCGDGKASPGERCDPTASPNGCAAGASCSARCDTCSAPKECPTVACSPSCTEGFTCCSGRCLELKPKKPNTNPDDQAQTIYCGSCGHACTLGEYCDSDGTCKPFYTGDASFCSDAKACARYWAEAHPPAWWIPPPSGASDCTALSPTGTWSCIGGSCCAPGREATCKANLEPYTPCKSNETLCPFPSWHGNACVKACVDLKVGTGGPTQGPIHCGACGRLCRRGEYCYEGACRHPSEASICDLHYYGPSMKFRVCDPSQRCCPIDLTSPEGQTYYRYECR